jgi:hypothetical protein
VTRAVTLLTAVFLDMSLYIELDQISSDKYFGKAQGPINPSVKSEVALRKARRCVAGVIVVLPVMVVMSTMLLT